MTHNSYDEHTADNLQNNNRGDNDKWFSEELYYDYDQECGWIHIKFPEAMDIIAFGLQSANNMQDRDPSEFRFLGRYQGPDDDKPNHFDDKYDEDEPNAGMDIRRGDLKKGFQLLGTYNLTNNNGFSERWQIRKFMLQNKKQGAKLTECLIIFDRTRDRYFDEGIQLGQILLYQ